MFETQAPAQAALKRFVWAVEEHVGFIREALCHRRVDARDYVCVVLVAPVPIYAGHELLAV